MSVSIPGLILAGFLVTVSLGLFYILNKKKQKEMELFNKNSKENEK